jgi:uncharacterized membrane protein
MSNITDTTTSGSNTATHAKDPGRPTTGHTDRAVGDRRARRISTETKSSYKTTELIAYVAAVIGVLIAAAVTDTSDFGTQEAWFYVTLLTVGYLVSRGLAKSGSRDYYDDEVGSDHR